MNASAKFFDADAPVAFAGKDAGKDAGHAPAFRWYDKDRLVHGRRLEDHLRFAVCYWHSFGWPGSDPFGGETFLRASEPASAMIGTIMRKRPINIAKPIVVLSQGVLVFKPAKALPLLPFAEL